MAAPVKMPMTEHPMPGMPKPEHMPIKKPKGKYSEKTILWLHRTPWPSGRRY